MAVTVCSARLACAGTALPPTRAAARVEVLPWDPGKADACACLRVDRGQCPRSAARASASLPVHTLHRRTASGNGQRPRTELSASSKKDNSFDYDFSDGSIYCLQKWCDIASSFHTDHNVAI